MSRLGQGGRDALSAAALVVAVTAIFHLGSPLGASQRVADLLPAGIAIVAGLWLGPVATLVCHGALMLALPLLTAWASRQFGHEISPVAGLLALALLCLWWSWRQLDRTQDFLAAELQRFRHSDHHLEHAPRPGERLENGLHALRRVTQRLRDLHRFVKDSLEVLPDATLVCDSQGRVVLANTAAAGLKDHAPSHQPRHDRRARPGDALRGQAIQDILSDLSFQHASGAEAIARLVAWPPAAAQAAARCPAGRELLIKTVPTWNARNQPTGWIVSLIDITALREAQRLRDEAVGFMSHDMRAPPAAILSLIEMRRTQPGRLGAEQFEQRVERHARRALALADGFTQLAAAQSRDYHLASHDLAELLREAVEDVWERAQQRQMTVRVAQAPAQALAAVDRELIARALSNLLVNALKYAPPHTDVACGLSREAGFWVLSVQDQGPGISAAAQAKLFDPFFRDQSVRDTEGVGLGLPFVQAVVLRHGGRVVVHSHLGEGSRFELWLPVGAADNADDGNPMETQRDGGRGHRAGGALPAGGRADTPGPAAEQPGRAPGPR